MLKDERVKKSAKSSAGVRGKKDAQKPQQRGTSCSAVTRAGKRCRRVAVRGGEFCAAHGGRAEETNAERRKRQGRPDRPRCRARRKNGEPCGAWAVAGATVCRMHGGSAPQVRAKANLRLLEMVLPAIRELRKIIDSKKASDADKLRAIQLLLNRTGFSERQTIDLTMREPTQFELLQQQLGQELSVSFDRAELDADEDDRPALGSGGGVPDDETLDALLAERDRRREREAATRLDNSGHDVIRAEVPSEAPRTAGTRLYEDG
jgi:hypothetical protein